MTSEVPQATPPAADPRLVSYVEAPRDPAYPTVLSILLGIPATIAGIIAFAVISDGDGQFNTTEALVFAGPIVSLIVLCAIDLIRWEHWKEANR